MKEGDSLKVELAVKFKLAVKFTCPFCGCDVSAGEVTNQNGESEPAVLHALPPCEKYLKLEPDEFLSECREKLMPATLS